MTRKYTRKQLKQPDEFITLSYKVWVWVREHVTRVAVMLGVAIVIVGAVWIWTDLAETAATEATTTVMRGLKIYKQDTVGADVDLQSSEDKEIPRFKSREDKLAAAIKAFTEVVDKEGARSDVGRVALLTRAAAQFELKQHDKATADYKAYLADAEPEDRLFVKAVEGLAYSYEAQKKWDAALQTLKRLPRDGDGQFRALYHEARILAAKGDKKRAIERYERVVKESDSRFLSEKASQWLATLAEDA